MTENRVNDGNANRIKPILIENHANKDIIQLCDTKDDVVLFCDVNDDVLNLSGTNNHLQICNESTKNADLVFPRESTDVSSTAGQPNFNFNNCSNVTIQYFQK